MTVVVKGGATDTNCFASLRNSVILFNKSQSDLIASTFDPKKD